MAHRKKKLVLHKQTLLVLSRRDLVRAAGGAPVRTNTCANDTDTVGGSYRDGFCPSNHVEGCG